VAKASRAYDPPPSEIETLIDEAKRRHGERAAGLSAEHPEQYEKQIKQLHAGPVPQLVTLILLVRATPAPLDQGSAWMPQSG